MNYSSKNINNKRKGLRSNSVRRRNSVFLFCLKVFLLILVTGMVIVGGLAYGSLKGIIASAPKTYDLKPKYSSTRIYDSAGNEVQSLSSYNSNRITVNSDEIDEDLKHAIIAIEDERFYQHNGIDIKGIARALINDLKTGRFSQGASTITQQLVKNNVFNVGGEDNMLAKLKRKIQEQYLALCAEKELSKDTILTDYLNTINLGKGTLGVETASKYYFGKSCSDLTLSECAVLAGITKNPAYLNPVDYPQENNERRLTILSKMLDLGFIDKTQYQEAVSDEAVYTRISEHRSQNQNPSTYSYFTDALIMQIVDDLVNRAGYSKAQAYELVYSGGLKVYSTQDNELQKIADEVINDSKNYPVDTKYSLEYYLEIKRENGEKITYTTSNLKAYFVKKGKKSYKTIYDSKKKMEKAVAKFKKAVVKDTDVILSEKVQYALQPQLSYSLIDNATGQIKVLVGGRGQKQDDLSLNRATAVTRQPGSTFKILSTYAPGIDTGGMTLATVYDDCKYKYEGGQTVHNAEKKYFGLMTIRDAIIESDNVVAVKAITSLTPQVGYDYLQKLGFTTLVQNRTNNGVLENDVTQSLALGGITDGVTNVELTAAYASIANKGEYNTPILYTKILDKDGNVLLENNTEPTRVMKESTAWLLTSAMQDVVKKGTGKEAKLSSKMAVAGKTGTTSNNYDYWFCGYTPYYTASIWTGYDYNTDFATSADYHKEIWAKIMNKVITQTKQPIRNFDSCDSIEKKEICIKSGKLPVSHLCSNDPEKSMVRTEYFEMGTVPTESCDTHVSLTLCKDSHKIVTEYCPKEKQYTKVYRKRPSGSKGTTDDSPYTLPNKGKCNIHTKKWQEEQKKKEEQQKLIDEWKKQHPGQPVPPSLLPQDQTTTQQKKPTAPAATTQKKKKN